MKVYIDRFFEGPGKPGEGSYRVWPAVPQETLHVPSRHQLRQNQGRGSLEAEPHTVHRVLMAKLAEQGEKPCFGHHQTGGDLYVPRLATSQLQGRREAVPTGSSGSVPTAPARPWSQVHLIMSAYRRRPGSSQESRVPASGEEKGTELLSPQTLQEGALTLTSATVSPSMEPCLLSPARSTSPSHLDSHLQGAGLLRKANNQPSQTSPKAAWPRALHEGRSGVGS